MSKLQWVFATMGCLMAAGALAGEAGRHAAVAPSGAAGIAGTYRATGPGTGPRGGEPAASVLEIVPYGADEAYVRARTTWANGHSCEMKAIFRVERSALIHDGQTATGEACRFTVERKSDRFVFHDRSGTCLGSCGSRGTFNGDDRFLASQRRPVRDLDRLLASDEYSAAVAAREGRIPRPEVYLLPAPSR